GAVDALGKEPEDEALHEVRKRAKQARYAAEAVTGVIGKPAGRLASAVAGVQEVLGGLQDAVVAEEWLRKAATGGGPGGRGLGVELPAVEYHDRYGRPKRVRYWLMEPEDATGKTANADHEVDDVRWLNQGDAAATLTYERDRHLLTFMPR